MIYPTCLFSSFVRHVLYEYKVLVNGAVGSCYGGVLSLLLAKSARGLCPHMRSF